MKEKAAICFVDDDPEELIRFRESLEHYYIVGTGPTLDEALDKLRAQRVGKPDLFLLDLYYGPDTSEVQRAKITALDGELSAVETRMRALLLDAGQSTKGGFDLAGEVEKRFPQIPRVLFSRKAFVEDALDAQKKGLPLLAKPDPTAEDTGATDKERKDKAFARHADEIKRFLDGKINLNTWWVRNRTRVESFATGFFFFFVKIVWDFWKGNTHLTEILVWAGLLVLASYALFFKK